MREGSAAVLLQRLVETGSAADAEVSAWLADGFRVWLKNDGNVALPAALGLPCKVLLLKREMRDEWLREAAIELSGGPWQRAEQLRDAVRRYASTSWPRWRAMRLPPRESTRLQLCLHFAFRACATMPGSVQAFAKIVGDSQAKGAEELGIEAA